MKISIAMATYNGERYITEQLDSFLKQTRLPDELVVSDDGSDDETIQIVERFSKKAPFDVTVIKDQENIGYAGNFSRALQTTSGDLVFLSDQDDYWFSDKLETMENWAIDSPDAMVFMCDAVLTDGNLNEVGLTKISQIRAGGLPMTAFVMGCCTAIKRDFLNLLLPIPKEYPAHDNWIAKIATGLNVRITTQVPLQYYRRHENNTSNVLANQTYKITRLLALKAKILAAFRNDTNLKYSLEKAILLKAWIDKTEKLQGYAFTNNWDRFESDVNREIQALQRRIEIRDEIMLRRFLKSTTLWVNGDYKKFNGLKSAISDLIGPKN